MKKLGIASILFIIITLIISCSGIFEPKKNLYQPTSLKELHTGFFDEEIIPENVHQSKEEITVIVTGHLYPLIKYTEVYKTFIDSINHQKPDYLFLLGDLVQENNDQEWDTILTRLGKINCKVYFTPGNHDLNYHFERYFGKRDHQYEAEIRYINHVGYRYKLLKDDFANYLFFNPNDSLDRVLSYLNIIKPNFDTTKHMILLSGQALWDNTNQEADDPHTWVYKAFSHDDILPEIGSFDYLIHGDWSGKFSLGTFPKDKGQFQIMSVGNRTFGDSLYITCLKISSDTLIASSIPVIIPKESSWWKK